MKIRIKILFAALLAMAMGAQAQTIINTGFTAGDGYADGDLAANTAWAAVANTGANAFDVTNAAGAGLIDTAATTVDTNTGSYAYLTAASAGNAVNDQWSGVVDFQLTVSAANEFDDANGDIWEMGLSTVNGFHPHVWYGGSNDEFFSNIVMHKVRGVRTPTETAQGKRIDNNLFFSSGPEDKDRYAEFGWDLNSINGDPLFVDPAHGDYSVKDGSPAFEIGFKNFPMDQFGVKKPSLKAIAQTPVFPELKTEKMRSNQPQKKVMSVQYWLGAKLQGLEGEDFSAYGTRKEDGGVALIEVPKTSPAAKAGLQQGDLIQGINGKPVKTIDDLLAVYMTSGNVPLKVKMIRMQRAQQLTIKGVPFVEVKTSGKIIPTLGKISAKLKTNNDSLKILLDGKLAKGYGPVFSNGTTDGAYKIDLGKMKPVTAITSWTHNYGGVRGAQKLTIYGSASEADPGWNFNHAATFIPLGSIDTRSLKQGDFNGVTLKGELGRFRWIIWQVDPISEEGENAAFQELSVK